MRLCSETSRAIAEAPIIAPEASLTKAPQTITHELALLDCEVELKKFLTAMEMLREKLGPMLFQFPYFNRVASSTVEDFLERLAPFLAGLPRRHRFAVELRNKNWLGPKLYEILRKHKTALALIGHPWMPRPREWIARGDPITSDFTYIRWLGDRKGIEEAPRAGTR